MFYLLLVFPEAKSRNGVHERYVPIKVLVYTLHHNIPVSVHLNVQHIIICFSLKIVCDRLAFFRVSDHTGCSNEGPIPMAARSKACDCGRSLAGIAGSNPDKGMDGCLLWV